MSLGPALFNALLATFLYVVPAGSIHLMVRGLADPRYERWEAPEDARAWKARYRHWAAYALLVNRVLFAAFGVQLLAFLALRTQDCARNASHLAAAAWNLHRVTEVAFAAGFILLFLFALAALVWSATYLFAVRQRGWDDPRRRDPLIVHLVVVPLALVLMWVAFAVVPGMVCTTLP